jgi:hypothetical protein
MKQKCTAEQRLELFQLYLAGGADAVEHLAERYGMSLEYIGKLANRNGYSRNELNRWTPDEIVLARKLLKENAPKSAFPEQLNRTRQACLDKVTRMDGNKDLRPSTALVVPAEVIEDRVKRLMAPRSLTALLMGDPAPHQSALSRRGMQV